MPNYHREVIVIPLSKLWGKWLLVGQYANVLLMLLMAFVSAPDVPFLVTWKAHIIEIHAAITGVIGTLQAMAKALPDANANGVPDLFESAPVPPAPPAEGV